MKTYISGDLLFPEKLDKTFLLTIEDGKVKFCSETTGFLTPNHKPVSKEIDLDDLVELNKRVQAYITKNGELTGTLLSSEAKKIALIEPTKPLVLNKEDSPEKPVLPKLVYGRNAENSLQNSIPKTKTSGTSEGEGGGGEWANEEPETSTILQEKLNISDIQEDKTTLLPFDSSDSESDKFPQKVKKKIKRVKFKSRIKSLEDYDDYDNDVA